MKKLLLTLVLIASAFSLSAQSGTQSVMPKFGYQTEYKRFSLGAEYRYFFTDNIRVAPGFAVQFPKNDLWGFDIDVNVHYVLPIQNGLAIYPLVGVGMLNYHANKDEPIKDYNKTNFAFNLGAGVQYDVLDNGYLNFEFKYAFTKGSDPANFALGYGIRF